jgi:hypothetical protein
MATYRETRNIEASLVDYIKAQLTAGGWQGVSVVKAFNMAYEKPLPVICIREDNQDIQTKEIGSTDVRKNYNIFIDIFGGEEGLCKDLSDWLIDILKVGCPYYEYVIDSNGTITSQTLVSKIEIPTFSSNKKINVPTDSKHDRNRRFISLTVYIAGKA